MQALAKLTQAGVAAGVICAPVLPGITDSPAALDKLVHATKEAGGRYIYANPLFLKPCSASVFLPFLEKEFPHLAGRIIASDMPITRSSARLIGKRLSELMVALRKKHGIIEGSDGPRSNLEAVSSGKSVGAVCSCALQVSARRRTRVGFALLEQPHQSLGGKIGHKELLARCRWRLPALRRRHSRCGLRLPWWRASRWRSSLRRERAAARALCATGDRRRFRARARKSRELL